MEASKGGDAYGGRGPEILGVTWALTAFTTIFILLRIYVRLFMVQHDNKPRDFWALIWSVAVWVFGILTASFLSVAAHYGLGANIQAVISGGDLTKTFLYTWIWSTFSLLTNALVKVAVVAYFIDIGNPIPKIHKWSMIVLVDITVCVNIVNIFLIWFQCHPAQKAWNLNETGTCPLADVTFNYSIFSGSWSAFVDLILSLYPLPLIYKAKIAVWSKLVLVGMVGLGVFTCVCACMRTYELRVVQRSDDRTYDSGPLILWSTAEVWVMLIASSVPTLWPLLQRATTPHHSSGKRSQAKHMSDQSEKTLTDSEVSSSNRTSANSDATTMTATTDTTTTAHSSLATPEIEGAIAVKREVTVDRERRKTRHGMRPRALTKSWATASRASLARWSSSSRGPRSPSWARYPSSWARKPSWARGV